MIEGEKTTHDATQAVLAEQGETGSVSGISAKRRKARCHCAAAAIELMVALWVVMLGVISPYSDSSRKFFTQIPGLIAQYLFCIGQND